MTKDKVNKRIEEDRKYAKKVGKITSKVREQNLNEHVNRTLERMGIKRATDKKRKKDS